jgi:NAD+ kinase
MKKIILCPNPGRDRGLALTESVFALLKSRGAEPVICPFEDYAVPCSDPGMPAGTKLEAELPGAELLIAFGGDGTILHTARHAAPMDIPILGVNMGKKGFMAELEPADIGQVERVVAGDYALDRRMMLDAELLRDGETVYRDFALNDVVVAGGARIIELSVYGDGQRISAFCGDGIVVATPTGSTAYSLSAGGPIVEPIAENIILTPICAHVLIAKSFVLAPERTVTVEVGSLGCAYLSIDGASSVPLQPRDRIRVRKSKYVAELVRFSDKSFYKTVSEKLGER